MKNPLPICLAIFIVVAVEIGLLLTRTSLYRESAPFVGFVGVIAVAGGVLAAVGGWILLRRLGWGEGPKT